MLIPGDRAIREIEPLADPRISRLIIVLPSNRGAAIRQRNLRSQSSWASRNADGVARSEAATRQIYCERIRTAKGGNGAIGVPGRVAAHLPKGSRRDGRRQRVGIPIKARMNTIAGTKWIGCITGRRCASSSSVVSGRQMGQAQRSQR